MEEALVRILTPRRSIDIMRDVHAAKDQGKPYVVVFVGVNGVGKSTKLAKVAYWLLQHKVSVMMAACDTFVQVQLSNSRRMPVGSRSQYLRGVMRKILQLWQRKQYRRPLETVQMLFLLILLVECR
ncbi:hypothetical protein ACH5RR_032229 [Cinchona calisaya]|uniref:SRP54-type proteins GTP-binding domain-containing protein n=1 Tax=Cinchona calisaya TaxID=153742 RepID=A0ABD2YHH5_9GENT